MDLGPSARGSQMAQTIGSPPLQADGRPPQIVIFHHDIMQKNTLLKPSSQGLGAGFLGGKAFGEKGTLPRPALAPLFMFGHGKNPPQETIPMAVQNRFDTAHITQIGADTQDQDV